MRATMRATGNSATWVSGSRLTLAGVSGLGQQHERAGFGDGTEGAGDADQVIAARRARFGGDAGFAPAERAKCRPAHGSWRKLPGLEVARDFATGLRRHDGADHVAGEYTCALGEGGNQVVADHRQRG